MWSSTAFLFLFALKASASIYSGPVGFREAFMASTGTALKNSPGNLILNPAGLSFLEDKRTNITVSGSLAGFEKVMATTYDKNSDNLTYRALLVAGIFPIEIQQGYFAMYYFNPLDETSVSHSEDVANATTTHRNYEVLTTSSVGGVAGGWAPTQELGVGLSATMGFDIRDLYETLTVQTPALTSLQYTRTQVKYYYVQIVPGVLWLPHPRWSAGLTLQWRPFAFYNEGAAYIAQQSSQGMDLTEQVVNFKPHIKDESALTFGQRFVVDENDELLLDLSYQSRFSFQNQSGRELVISGIKSASLGWQHKVGSSIDLMFGYAHFDTNLTSTYLVTSGYAINRDSHHMLFGLYYKNIVGKADGIGQAITGGLLLSSDVIY